MAIDTDTVGCHGWHSDFSRTLHIGGADPTAELYIGEEGGREGVELDRQALVTADGPEVLSSYLWEDAWLGSRGARVACLGRSGREGPAGSVRCGNGHRHPADAG